MLRRGLRRGGFSLVEMLLVLAVLAVLAAVIVPNVVPALFRGQSAALAQSLDALNDALTDFRGDVGRYPSTLVYLVEPPPGAGATDACGRPLSGTNRWLGPYLQLGVDGGTIPVGDAAIDTDVRRDPATVAGGPVGDLIIDATGVDRSVADDLEETFDGNADLSAGTIRWADDGGGRGTLSFAFPVRGC